MTSLTSSAPWYFDLIELLGPWGAHLYHVIKVARIVSTQKANRAADLLFYCAAYRGGNTTVIDSLLSFIKLLPSRHSFYH